MPTTVQVRSGFSYVLLPDGRSYDENNQAVLTDDQYNQIPVSTARALWLVQSDGSLTPLVTESAPAAPTTPHTSPAVATPAVVGPHVFVQSSPATDWVFEHDMGRLPAVQVSTMDGRVVMPDVFIDTTYVYINWSQPTAGTVIVT